jgi:hypothetical protein
MNKDLKSLIAAADAAAKQLSAVLASSGSPLHANLHRLQLAIGEFTNTLSGVKSQL